MCPEHHRNPEDHKRSFKQLWLKVYTSFKLLRILCIREGSQINILSTVNMMTSCCLQPANSLQAVTSTFLESSEKQAQQVSDR